MEKTKRLLSLLIAFTMVFSLAACKKSTEDNSSDYEIVYEDEYVYVSGDSSGNSNDSSGDKDTNNSGGSSGNSGGSSTSKEDTKKFRGKTIRYATWKDPKQNEDGPVVAAFEKKYGVKVKIELMGEGRYNDTIAGLIAAGDSPDVFFCNNSFPACLSNLQPIDAAKLDLKDPIWDKGMMDVSTINGKTYLVNTVGNIWNEVDCVFYNKRLLKENNITTPEEYYKAGKWNFDAMTKVMRDVKALGPDYIGGYIDWETLLGSTGATYYKWENGKFSNGTNTMLTEVNRYLATCLKEGLINGINDNELKNDFKNGKGAIAVTNAFGLKKTGYWSTMNADDIGFTYLPDFDSSHKAVTTGLYRGWGIIKGAKEPEAAGAFLRYYLDVNNYDVSSAFINSEAESFFFKLTSGVSSNEKLFYLTGYCVPITGTPRNILTDIAKNDPSQVAAALSSIQNTLNSDVKRLNDFISQQIK